MSIVREFIVFNCLVNKRLFHFHSNVTCDAYDLDIHLKAKVLCELLSLMHKLQYIFGLKINGKKQRLKRFGVGRQPNNTLP